LICIMQEMMLSVARSRGDIIAKVWFDLNFDTHDLTWKGLTTDGELYRFTIERPRAARIAKEIRNGDSPRTA